MSKTHKIDPVCRKGFGRKNCEEITMHFRLLKIHFVIIVSLQSTSSHLAGLQLKYTTESQRGGKHSEARNIVDHSKKKTIT